MLQNVILIAASVMAGIITALRFIAPKTKTKVDDSILARLEAVEAVVLKIDPAAPAPAGPPPSA